MISKSLRDFYTKIRDPLLQNLRYNFSGLDENNIYPKSLPDFFKGAVFTLYGRYDRETAFSMRFAGEARGKLNEYVFQGDLTKAARGTQAIAQEWAFNKIYHLIGLMTGDRLTDNPLLDQIRELGDTYQILTPYSEKLAESD